MGPRGSSRPIPSPATRAALTRRASDIPKRTPTETKMPRFDRFVTLYLSHPLARSLWPQKGARVPILMYHSISDNLFGMSHPYYHINTLPEVFSGQMRWLRNAGYRTIALKDAWAGIEAGTDLSKTVVLTFDDGYRDFYTEGLPVLKQCGFSATIFLATDRIHTTPARIEGTDYLTWSDVRELKAEGIDFGSHTVSHPDLRSLGPDQIEYELGHSKEVIEQHLGVSVGSFSYPFGFPEEDKSFARFLEDVLTNLGFEYGVSTILGRASRRSNRFFLPRIPVNSYDDASLLRAKLEGGYDWLHWPQLLKKSIFHNAVAMQQERRTKVMG
jgi:peptidoglycan/xylan/chitin deacetylase (PgdA/CDA1 family)